MLDQRALSYACQRVEDFIVVNRSRDVSERGEALGLWLDFLGLDEDRKQQIADWLGDHDVDSTGEFMLGLIVGLFILEWQNDHGA